MADGASAHRHRHRRQGPRRDRRRPVAPARRHLHALPDDPQLPLERDRADVQHAAHDVHDAVHRAVERGRPDRRAHPLARPPGPGLVRAVRRAELDQRRAGQPPKAMEMVRILVRATRRWRAPRAASSRSPTKAGRPADRRPADAAPRQSTRRRPGCCAACSKSEQALRVAILTFDGFNELDSFIALGLINRLRTLRLDGRAGLPDAAGDVDERRRRAGAAAAGVRQRGRRGARSAAASTRAPSPRTAPLLDRLRLDPLRQTIGAQCSGTLLLARLGLLGDMPACTDMTTKPWVVEAGVLVVDEPFRARGPIATAGGCMASVVPRGLDDLARRRPRCCRVGTALRGARSARRTPTSSACSAWWSRSSTGAGSARRIIRRHVPRSHDARCGAAAPLPSFPTPTPARPR